MRTCRRNKQTIYYMNVASTTREQVDGYDTGNIIPVYGDLISKRVNISPATGQTAIELFGNESRYDKIIVVSRNEELPIVENNTKIFIDVTPNLSKTNYNYICKKIAKSLNVIAYALTSVEGDETTPVAITNVETTQEVENG